MKKLTVLILIFSLALACLASCAETENEGSVNEPSESSVVTESEAVTESSLTVEESSEEENSEQSEESIEIPDFNTAKVFYAHDCIGPNPDGSVEMNDMNNSLGNKSEYGLHKTYHNYAWNPYFKDSEEAKTSYMYVVVILYSSDENVPKEPLNKFLEAYGYIEDEEKTAALVEVEGVAQATVGYLPCIMRSLLAGDCEANNYNIYYSWLSKSCLGEDCQYYAPPLK